MSYRSKYRRSFIGFIKIPTLSCFLYSNTDTLLFFFIKLLTLFCLFYQNTDSLLSFFIKIPTIFCLFYQNTDALLPFLSKPTFFYFLVYVPVDKILLLAVCFFVANREISVSRYYTQQSLLTKKNWVG